MKKLSELKPKKISGLKTKKLRKLLKETESTLSLLQAEIARRELLRQEEEIEYLDDHLHHTEASLQTIRNFIAHLKK